MKGAVRRILRGSCCWWLIRERSRVVLKYGSPASVCYSRTAALHFSSLYLEVILENYKDLKKSQSPMNLFNSDSLTPFHFPKKKLHCFSMTERWCKTTRLAYLASRRSQVQSPQHSPLFIYSHEVCNKNNLWFYIYDRNSSFPRCSPSLRACHPPLPPLEHHSHQLLPRKHTYLIYLVYAYISNTHTHTRKYWIIWMEYVYILHVWASPNSSIHREREIYI